MTTKAQTATSGVEYLYAGTYHQPGEIYRVREGWEPATRYSPVALARMFEAAPAMLDALRVLLESAEHTHYKCDTGTVECYDDMAPGEHDGIQQAQAAIAAATGGSEAAS